MATMSGTSLSKIIRRSHVPNCLRKTNLWSVNPPPPLIPRYLAKKYPETSFSESCISKGIQTEERKTYQGTRGQSRRIRKHARIRHFREQPSQLPNGSDGRGTVLLPPSIIRRRQEWARSWDIAAAERNISLLGEFLIYGELHLDIKLPCHIRFRSRHRRAGQNFLHGQPEK